MAKNDTKGAASDVPTSEQITIDEFCIRLSLREKNSVAMIGAFEFDEKRNGRFKDTEDAYSKRYAAFVNKPA